METFYEDETVRLHLGDCLDVLPTLTDASVDAIVCDPPYGLADHPPRVIAETLAAWLAGDRASVPDGRGFMGRDWDRFVPPPAIWDECLRILKPGGHLMAFASARTVDLMGLSIRLAGLEIRDSIDWIHGNGMPKGRHQLKPAHEPIIVARKPLAGTIAATILAHGTGGLNVDACRVEASGRPLRVPNRRSGNEVYGGGLHGSLAAGTTDAGRWPTNVLLSHYPDCIDGGECQPGCPVAEMDAQSGISRSDARANKGTGMGYHGADAERGAWTGGDSGGASRFFPVFRYEAACELFGRVGLCERAIGAAGKSPKPGQRQSTAAKGAQGSVLHGGGINNPSPKSSAPTAESPSPTTHQPNEGSAPGSAQAKPAGWSALRAASAGSLCDSCVTAIAQSVAATQHGLSGRRELGLPSTHDSSERILNRSLALIVEDLESSDTTSTTTALTTSLGCVVAAIKTYTTGEYRSAAKKSGLPVLKYEAKAPASERPRLADGTAWPTVKPLALMRWLVRLVTPPGGTVLDWCAGTGTTLEAARLEGLNSIGVEREKDAAELCRVRLAKPYMTDLFGGGAA